MSIPDVNNKIWEIVRPLLPAKPNKPAHAVVVKLNEPENSSKQPAGNAYDGRLSLAAIYEAWLAGLPVQVKQSNWAKADYKYHRPDLAKKTLAKYEEYLNDFISYHKAISKKSKNPGVIASITPLAATFDISIDFTKASKYSLSRLQTSKNSEITRLLSLVGADNQSSTPASSKEEKAPEQLSNIIARIASEHLPQNLAAEVETVELLEAWPRNEFKVLSDAIFPYSDLPKAAIEEEITGWNYQQKADALLAAFDTGSNVKDKLSYQFDITVNRMLMDEIVFSGIGEDVQAQPATPRYGYEVPAEVDEAGVTEEYLDAFDKSLKLFSSLQAAGREELAVYATLCGHKTRYQLTCSMQSLSSAIKYGGSDDFKNLIGLMIEKIAEHHPLVAEHLTMP